MAWCSRCGFRRWILTFSYRPPGLTLGIAGSCLAVAGFAGTGAVVLFRRRRARARRSAEEGAGGGAPDSEGAPEGAW